MSRAGFYLILFVGIGCFCESSELVLSKNGSPDALAKLFERTKREARDSCSCSMATRRCSCCLYYQKNSFEISCCVNFNLTVDDNPVADIISNQIKLSSIKDGTIQICQEIYMGFRSCAALYFEKTEETRICVNAEFKIEQLIVFAQEIVCYDWGIIFPGNQTHQEDPPEREESLPDLTLIESGPPQEPSSEELSSSEE